MAEVEQKQETKRDRVRRLMIGPLQKLGMRFPKAVAEADGKKTLDRICDEMAYLSDENLRRMAEYMRTKGEGSKKDFWPSRKSFIAFAEVAQPRGLDELPALLGWFASEAGKKALAEGRLVAEYQFWQKHKMPPVTDGQKRQVEIDAGEMNSKARKVRERIARGVAPFGDDGQWLKWFDAMEVRVRGYVENPKKAGEQ